MAGLRHGLKVALQWWSNLVHKITKFRLQQQVIEVITGETNETKNEPTAEVAYCCAIFLEAGPRLQLLHDGAVCVRS